MSGKEKDIARAKEAARMARARLSDTMGELQARLRPRTLLNGAWHGVRERGQDLAEEAFQVARARPLATSAIVAGAVALAARGPIWRALTALFALSRETPQGEAELTFRTAQPCPGEDEAAQPAKEIA